MLALLSSDGGLAESQMVSLPPAPHGAPPASLQIRAAISKQERLAPPAQGAEGQTQSRPPARLQEEAKPPHQRGAGAGSQRQNALFKKAVLNLFIFSFSFFFLFLVFYSKGLRRMKTGYDERHWRSLKMVLAQGCVGRRGFARVLKRGEGSKAKDPPYGPTIAPVGVDPKGLKT